MQCIEHLQVDFARHSEQVRACMRQTRTLLNLSNELANPKIQPDAGLCGSQNQNLLASQTKKHIQLATAHKLVASQQILLWMTPSETPKALQASECSELLDPMRASCWISAQH